MSKIYTMTLTEQKNSLLQQMYGALKEAFIKAEAVLGPTVPKKEDGLEVTR